MSQGKLSCDTEWLNKPNHVIARPVLKLSSKSGGLSPVSIWRAETGTCTFLENMADIMLVGIVLEGGEGRLEEIEQNFNTLSLFLLWVPLNYLQVRAKLWLQINLIGGDRNLWNFWESNQNLVFSSQRLNWVNCPIPVLIWHNQTLHFPHCVWIQCLFLLWA